MRKLMQGIEHFWKEEEATEVVEWALVGGLVVAVGGAVFLAIGTKAEVLLQKVSTLLT